MTTGESAATRLFPAWMKALDLVDVGLDGIDLPLRAPPEQYRAAVKRIKNGERAVGGLVTTHKIDLFEACRDLFDTVDTYAELCGEASCLVRRDGGLEACATDPISSARAFDDFFSSQTPIDVLSIGGGGAATAITVQLIERRIAKRVIVVDTTPTRLARIQAVHRKLDQVPDIRYVEARDPRANDRLIAELAPGSLVINATGLGKDAPGSPLTDDATFPEGASVWDINYRGELKFLRQARLQQEARRLHVEDGWRYFIHGWAVVIGRVFDLEIDADRTARLAAIAETERRGV